MSTLDQFEAELTRDSALAQRGRNMVSKCAKELYPEGDDYPLRDSRAGDLIWALSDAIDTLIRNQRALIAVAHAAKEATVLQEKQLATYRSHGIVFKDIGNDPTNWQHVAFSVYSDLCELASLLDGSLTALKEGEV